MRLNDPSQDVAWLTSAAEHLRRLLDEARADEHDLRRATASSAAETAQGIARLQHWIAAVAHVALCVEKELQAPSKQVK